MIRKRLFEKHYNKLIASRSSKQAPRDINALSSISILVRSAAFSARDLQEARSYFSNRGLSVFAYLIGSIGDIPEEVENIELINRKESTWFGVPDQELLIQWLRRKTDVLIAINPDDDPFYRYMVASSNSRLKASIDIGGDADSNIDFYVRSSLSLKKSLLDQCKIVYESLESIAAKPRIIR